jgi:hypothetical protein
LFCQPAGNFRLLRRQLAVLPGFELRHQTTTTPPPPRQPQPFLPFLTSHLLDAVVAAIMRFSSSAGFLLLC